MTLSSINDYLGTPLSPFLRYLISSTLLDYSSRDREIAFYSNRHPFDYLTSITPPTFYLLQDRHIIKASFVIAENLLRNFMCLSGHQASVVQNLHATLSGSRSITRKQAPRVLAPLTNVKNSYED